ncbi:MAG: ATP phosphoribosyltransferase [Deltaproteobacteria bacterium]|nr:ATP phosphoribosyltransferase [Deltaproteobacteria bacterium]
MRLVLPKGRLLQGVLDLLARAGLTFEIEDRNYSPRASDARIEARIFKVRAVPQLVALGNFDLGFCGLDLVKEADYEDVVPVLDLGLNPVDLVVAVAEEHRQIVDHPPRRPVLIATEYERTADRWALAHNLAHITIQTYGSTEGYAPADADIVFDCRETGRTLAANDLVVIETIVESSTYMVANRRSLASPGTGGLIRELECELRRALEGRDA